MRKYLAEFIGTTLFVFFGCGIAVMASLLLSAMGMLPAAFCTLTVAAGFGLVTAGLTFAFGKVSGGHLNPVISLSLCISGRMSVRDLPGYLIGQFAGGIAGAALLMTVIGGKTALGANGYDELSILGSKMWIVFLVEALMTFTLIFVVLSAREKEEFEPSAAIYTGLAVAFLYLFGYPFSGASANPARSLGPAVFQEGDALSQVWLFIAAPLLGSLLAAVLYRLMNKKEKAKLSMEEEELLLAADEAEFSEAETALEDDDGDFVSEENM